MAEAGAALVRDFGVWKGRILGLLAVLAGFGLAGLVWTDGARGWWLQISLLGTQPALVNDVPFLWTMVALLLTGCLALFLVWVYVSGEFDRPALGLLAFALFADAVPGVFQVALAMILLILVERALRHGDLALRLTPLIFPIAWLVLSYSLTFIQAPKMGSVTMNFLFRSSFMFTAILLPAILRTRRHIEILFHYLLIAACISATAAIVQFLLSMATGMPITFAAADMKRIVTPFGPFPRCTGLMNHPNHQTNAMAAMAILALYFALRPKGRIRPARRVYYLLVYTYLAIGVFIAWSRSGWLALGVATCLLPVLRWPRLALYYLVFGGVVAYLGYTSGVLQAMYNWVKDLNASSADFRWRMDHIAVKAFLQHPWFGVGVDQMLEYNNPFNLQVHNTYLMALSELGIFGCLALLTLGGMLFLRMVERLLHSTDPWQREWLIGLSLAWSITVVQNLVAMFLWLKFIWAMVGITEALILISRDSARGTEPADTPFLPLRPTRPLLARVP